MASKILGKALPLDYIYLETIFLLLNVTELFEYTNGERTSNLIGYTYEVVDLHDFDKIRIKIKGQKKPLLTNEELQKRREDGEKIYVELQNATITPYFNGKTVEDSFSAVGITFTKLD